MAEGAEAAPNSSSRLYQSITQWIADNFYVCEGYSIPRCLLYEMYIENCTQNAQNQVNPATFGKLVRLVFPDLGTRRLGTRGSARYHYDGIHIKKSSSFYAHYCYLLAEKKNHSGDGSSSEDATNYESNSYRKGTSGISLQTEKDKFGSPLPEFKRFSSWEQELGKTHSYKIVALLADEYCNYCQDVLQNLRNKELDRVEDLITSFWKSLQPETIMLMSLPDICQLFKCYDRQLFKEMESILLDDFLEDVTIQYLKSVRLFSKNVKLWLLTVLEDFPLLLRMSKIKEVTMFVKRLRRKTYLSNMAKTMRIVLNNSSRVTILKSDLNAIINQGIVDIPGNPLQNKFRNMDEMESDMELKCLNNLISLLGTSTDVRVFLNCMSSNLQAFVIQPSKNKEEFRKLAANFQLRWNFLLTAVSKAMTLCHTDSFGSWHLFNLLLLEYVIHILQSHIEEEGDGTLSDIQENDSPTQLVHEPVHLWDNFSAEQFRARAPEPTQVTLTQSQSDVNLNSIILRVLSCLVDSATGNKLIQVMLEDKATKSSVKLNLPVGKEALVTLKDGQRFIIHTCDSQQSCTSICYREIQTDL